MASIMDKVKDNKLRCFCLFVRREKLEVVIMVNENKYKKYLWKRTTENKNSGCG